MEYSIQEGGTQQGFHKTHEINFFETGVVKLGVVLDITEVDILFSVLMIGLKQNSLKCSFIIWKDQINIHTNTGP